MFSSRTKTVKLALVRKALKQSELPKPDKLTISEVIFKTTGCDIHLRKECKQGVMIIIKEMPSARGSPVNRKFKTLQSWT